MEEEIILAGQTAPEPEPTVVPDTEVLTPEEQPVKVFTQEELDAAIGKRLAREQRKWEREKAVPAYQAPTEIPSADYFASTEDYAEALAEQRAEQKIAQREAAKHQKEVFEAYQDREEEAREKYDDFDQVIQNPKLAVTELMAQTIRESDIGPDVAYYLGTNPKEAARISKLSPASQIKEVGKIEIRLESNPSVKKTTNAPAPIAPVSARSTGSPAYDTTDPRSIKTMTTSEWIEADRQRQIKKLEAQRNR
jgi:hypothetical protein